MAGNTPTHPVDKLLEKLRDNNLCPINVAGEVLYLLSIQDSQISQDHHNKLKRGIGQNTQFGNRLITAINLDPGAHAALANAFSENVEKFSALRTLLDKKCLPLRKVGK